MSERRNLPTLDTDDARLLCHALGLTETRVDDWRNYYVSGPDDPDLPRLEKLVAAELMEEAPRPGHLAPTDRLFIVTELGKCMARVERRKLWPPPTPGAKRYRRWLSIHDVLPDLTFGDYLRRGMFREGVL